MPGHLSPFAMWAAFPPADYYGPFVLGIREGTDATSNKRSAELMGAVRHYLHRGVQLGIFSWASAAGG